MSSDYIVSLPRAEPQRFYRINLAFYLVMVCVVSVAKCYPDDSRFICAKLMHTLTNNKRTNNIA